MSRPGGQALSAPVQALPRRAPGAVFNMATPLLDQHIADGRGGRPALHVHGGPEDGRTISYADLQRLANRAGNALAEAGVEPEQRVALLLPDGPAFVATFLGAMKLGAVPVPLNTAAPAPDLLYFLDNSRARALVAAPELLASVREALERDEPALRLLRTVFVDGHGARPHGHERDYRAALAAASPHLEAFASGADEPSYWLYSSGTTGRPKAAVHLHGDMLACVAPYAEEVLRLGPDDVTFSVARLFFSYGLVNSLYLPLLAGASVVLCAERPDVPRTLEVMRREGARPTLFFSVPTGYGQLCAALERGDGRDHPFGNLRLAVSAGEALPAPLYHRWRALTVVELLDGLGSTEVGYIFCSALPGDVRPGSSGRPIGDHALKLVDEQGQEVSEVDEPGELWVRAASTALHYWNQRERSKATFVGEWTRTGDRYSRDADGYYWNQGRVDDVFKVSGQWVSPLEVESCLLEHTAVLECAVVGRADEGGLLRPAAFVVPRPGASVTVEDLQAHVRSRLLPHKYPRWVAFVTALPKTTTGKVQRYRLRQEGGA